MPLYYLALPYAMPFLPFSQISPAFQLVVCGCLSLCLYVTVAVTLHHGGRYTSRRPSHYVTVAIKLHHGRRYTLSFMAVITLQGCCEIVFLPHLSFMAACCHAFMSQRLLHYFIMAVNPFYGYLSFTVHLFQPSL